MPLRCVCPGCGASYQIAEQHAGRTVQCKKCQVIFPATPAPGPAAPPARAAVTRTPAAAPPPPPPRRVEAPPRPVRRARAEPERPRGIPVACVVGVAAAGCLALVVFHYGTDG